ncbi:PRTRC system protein E [Caballeronia sp. dw_19]|jgi:PRTRC genetic system protein E|uniref:PRTRC system protein E n=1 Tax=Caballeronia sp. dw_19 TaxID=2719791 RepID=UPI001BD388D7|nr:PRTRC system protein E [Caballeronia sp. dw_19]
MFVALEPLLNTCEKITLTLKKKGDEIVVFVMPQGTTKDAAMLQPLAMTASAAELDAAFVEHLAAYTGAHASLAEQVAVTTAILEAAQKTQVTKATKTLGKGGRPALPAPSASSESSDDDSDAAEEGDQDDQQSNAVVPPAAVEEAAPKGTDLSSLFD